MAKKKAKKKVAPTVRLRDMKAQSDERAIVRYKQLIRQSVKEMDVDLRTMATETGISVAVCRGLLKGDIPDLKLSSLARLLPYIGLDIR